LKLLSSEEAMEVAKPVEEVTVTGWDVLDPGDMAY
jgi:hypothetical protein